MKKFFIISFLIMTVLITGCQNNIQKYNPSSEDVVDMHGEIDNMDRFQDFYNNVNSGKKDTIRVVTYTTEGDPWIHDLEYDGEVIKASFDTTKGVYATDGSVNTGTCTSIDVVETTGRTEYLLDGCGDYAYYGILTIFE